MPALVRQPRFPNDNRPTKSHSLAMLHVQPRAPVYKGRESVTSDSTISLGALTRSTLRTASSFDSRRPPPSPPLNITRSTSTPRRMTTRNPTQTLLRAKMVSPKVILTGPTPSATPTVAKSWTPDVPTDVCDSSSASEHMSWGSIEVGGVRASWLAGVQRRQSDHWTATSGAGTETSCDCPFHMNDSSAASKRDSMSTEASAGTQSTCSCIVDMYSRPDSLVVAHTRQDSLHPNPPSPKLTITRVDNPRSAARWSHTTGASCDCPFPFDGHKRSCSVSTASPKSTTREPPTTRSTSPTGSMRTVTTRNSSGSRSPSVYSQETVRAAPKVAVASSPNSSPRRRALPSSPPSRRGSPISPPSYHTSPKAPQVTQAPDSGASARKRFGNQATETDRALVLGVTAPTQKVTTVAVLCAELNFGPGTSLSNLNEESNVDGARAPWWITSLVDGGGLPIEQDSVASPNKTAKKGKHFSIESGVSRASITASAPNSRVA